MSGFFLLQRFIKKKNSRVRENRRKMHLSYPHFSKGWYVGAVLVIIGFGGGGDVAWSLVAHYAAQHSYFAVQDIQVSSHGRFSTEQIRAWSGLTLGMNLWTIDPPQLEARLRAQPWIQAARVKREFPDRVHIVVSIRRPVAIVWRQPFTYLDDTGAYFVIQEGEKEIDLPYISGLETMSLDTPTARAVLADVVHLLSLAHLWRESLSEIHWDQRQGYTLFLVDRPVTIHLGKEATPEKFAQVRTVLDAWPVDRPAALFDARFARQVVVRPDPHDRGHNRQDLTRHPL
jgi:cell division septal protein FtsQ